MTPAPSPTTSPAPPGSGHRFPAGLDSRLLLSGEIHYFRLAADDWEDRLDLAVETGLDAVATYIPWLWHECPDGSFDLSGRTRPERDLGRFLDLCAARGLGVIARPGPFVMAELKNEGLPYSLFTPGPDGDDDLRSPGWDGRRPAETVVDYLHPRFLSAARRWYEAVIPVVAARTERCYGSGGSVLAVQLDNEIGMLPWVTNSPDLSERSVAALVRGLVETEGRAAVTSAYGLDPDDLAGWVATLRSPPEDLVLRVHRDLGDHHRRTYAQYVETLAGWARELGLEVPLLVNVHGCWGEEARKFPLGISQLQQTWADPTIVPGTDYYVGDPTPAKLPALWAANAFLAATLAPGQPTGCLEFDTGRGGDFGEAMEFSSGPEATPLKAQLFVAQGNTFLNYYLFSGGCNPLLDSAVGDGNDRIAGTGERHGFAAPVDPEGRRSEELPLLESVTRALTGQAELLRAARPEPSPVTLGYVPDHYMTEFCYPGSAREAAFVAELERFRGCGPRDILTRALLFSGFAPDAVDLQRETLDLPTDRVLALAPTSFLDGRLQRDLLAWVRRGGRLLLHGPVPRRDLLARPATDLLDALGLTAGDPLADGPNRYPSVRPEAPAVDGLGPADLAEVRVGFVQPLGVGAGVRPDVEVLARIVGGGEPCAVRTPLGAGSVLVVAADLPCKLPLWNTFFARLGLVPPVTVETDVPGVVVVPTATPDGTRVVHVLNVSPWPATVTMSRDGSRLHDPLRVPARTGAWLVQRPGEPAELAYAGADGSVR